MPFITAKKVLAIVLENEEAAGQSDDGWTVVQSKNKTKSTTSSKSVVSANIGARHRSGLMPTISDKVQNQTMTYADLVRGKRSSNAAIAIASIRKCICQQRNCTTCRSGSNVRDWNHSLIIYK